MGSQPPRIRLAILEADTPQPQTNAEYGGYGGVFTALLRTAALANEPPAPLDSIVDLSVYHAVGDDAVYPDLDSIDAILISGSKHNSFDNDPWILKLVEFTKKCIDSGRVRVIGVCFGHQIVGRSLGVEVKRSDLGWEVAVVDVNLTPKGKEIFQLEKMVSFQPRLSAPRLGASEGGLFFGDKYSHVTAHPPNAPRCRNREPSGRRVFGIHGVVPCSGILLTKEIHHCPGPPRVHWPHRQ